MSGSSVQRLLCLYSYDPLDRQTGFSYPGGSPLQRFYRKNQICTELQGNLQTSFFQNAKQPLAELCQENGKTTTALLAADQQFSILKAMDVTQLQAIAYSPYGFHPACRGQLSLLNYNGERPDTITGHYPLGNGYRAFNPVLMRFNSPDRWSPFGRGGINAYVYCAGDPINRRDPNGRFWFSKGSWFNSLLKGLNKNLSKRSTTTHPSRKLTDTTVRLLNESLERLGGEKAVAKLAKKAKLTPKQYFTKKSSLTNQLKSNPHEIFSDSPHELVDENIKLLIAREVALTDLQAAFGAKNNFNHDYYSGLIEQTRDYIELNRDLRNTWSGGLPSSRLLEDPSAGDFFHRPPPPSYEDALKNQ